MTIFRMIDGTRTLVGATIRKGDIVITVKGCRFYGPPGEMEVLKTGSKWRKYDTALCVKPNGMKSSFLIKNLRKVVP